MAYRHFQAYINLNLFGQVNVGFPVVRRFPSDRVCQASPLYKHFLVRSFARIHETNLKKQGMLGLTFENKQDYELVQEGDLVDVLGLTELAPGKPLEIVLHNSDGSSDRFLANHTLNENQIQWFKAGSALNLIRQENHQ
mgnify:CR=1 FL=1